MPTHPAAATAEGLPRHRIEQLIDRLIAVLDDVDGDPDLEPNLGDTVGDDREGDTCDDEPSVWTEYIDQSAELRFGTDQWLQSEDAEPDLGFCIAGAGCTGGADDGREGDDEREKDGDEDDYSPSDEVGYVPWLGDGHAIASRMLMERAATRGVEP